MTRQCIIQTPIVFIPYSTYKVNNKITFDFFFLNLQVDKGMCELRNFIEEINKLANSKIKQDILVAKNCPKKKRGRPKKADTSSNQSSLHNSNSTVKSSNNSHIQLNDNNFRPKEFVSNIKMNNGCFGNKAKKMRVNCYDNIMAFDPYKKPLPLEYLKGKSYVKMLLSPTKIWVNKDKYGVFWEALQLKIYPKTVLNRYMFLDGEKDTSNIEDQYKFLDNTVTNTVNSMAVGHPKYGKYFDMVRKGVPKQAVKNKMLMDGVDPEILDSPNIHRINPTNINPGNTPPPPPPPLPLPSMSSLTPPSSSRINDKNISSDIGSQLFGELLSKTKGISMSGGSTKFLKPLNRSTMKKKSPKKVCGLNNFTPTLDDILQKRSMLKKIESESDA